MTGDPTNDALLTRYLLGELSAEECSKVERDCLDDDKFFEQLEAIEAELADDYVRGALDRRRRKQFEKRVLNTQGGLALIESSNIMIGSDARRRPPISPWKASMAVAAALTFFVGLGWFTLERHPPLKQVATSVAPKAAPVSATPSGVKAPPIATFVLISGSVRGEGETNEIKIPSNAKTVRFRIDLLSNEYRTYDASLNRVEGQRLFVQNHLKPRRSTLFVELPASKLPSGTSILTLTANAEPVAKYVIRVLPH